MLILTRKLGESINIGEDIRISVLGIHGRQVRIGIDAPLDVVVHREEIYVKIQEENRKAQKTIPGDLKGMVQLIKGKLRGQKKADTPQPPVDYKDDEPKRGGNGQSKRPRQ